MVLRLLLNKYFPPKTEFQPPVQAKEGRPWICMVTFETNPRGIDLFRDI